MYSTQMSTVQIHQMDNKNDESQKSMADKEPQLYDVSAYAQIQLDELQLVAKDHLPPWEFHHPHYPLIEFLPKVLPFL